MVAAPPFEYLQILSRHLALGLTMRDGNRTMLFPAVFCVFNARQQFAPAGPSNENRAQLVRHLEPEGGNTFRVNDDKAR